MSAKQFTSWGNFPQVSQSIQEIYWQDQIPKAIDYCSEAETTTLAVGLGRSYGDSCLSESGFPLRLIQMNRVIHFDTQVGILTAEAGISLQEILSIIVPHGWFLSVTPGTKYVTLGGAIANDVHGKNHHTKGTFGCFVEEFGLFRSDSGLLVCNNRTNSQLYSASIGGLGLTGVITWATIRLQRIQSTNVSSIQARFSSIYEFFQISNELDKQNEFSVSWVDCTASGKGLGRGIYTAGNFADDTVIESYNRRSLSFPTTPPFSLINGLSVRVFNTAYWRHSSRTKEAFKMHYEPFFYPLDRVQFWNRVYGKRGFQQYQCLIPPESVELAIPELLSIISKSGIGSFLAVLKRCGNILSPGMLSFPKLGTTLAIDFPQTDHLQAKLIDKLNAVVIEANGRLYPAKDAQMPAEMFQSAYPNWLELNTLRDPAIMSRFWARVSQ